MPDEKRDKGRFTERPDGAAKLFNPESGRKAALSRWEKKETRNREALVKFVSDKVGYPVTYGEALDYTVLSPQFREALGGKTSAAKIILQLLGEMPEGADAKVIVDNSQLYITNTISFESPEAAKVYIEDQRSQGNFKQAAEVEEVLAGEIVEGEAIEVEITFDDSD